MRHSCISFLSISLFLLTACSGEKGSHDQVSTVSIDKGVEHFDAATALYSNLLRHSSKQQAKEYLFNLLKTDDFSSLTK